jgi:hypothetical protein
MKIKIAFLICCYAALSNTAWAAPEMFKDSMIMMESHNDYPPENGSYKILSKKPLHIQISPTIFKGDVERNINYEANKAAVYAAYRVLFQTPANSIKVTVLPRELDLQKHKYTPEPKYGFTFSLSREKALKLSSQYAGIDNSDDLFQSDGYQWAESFRACCYSDRGNPGLAAFVQELKSSR